MRSWLSFLFILALTGVAIFASLALGARDLHLAEVMRALWRPDPVRTADIIVWDMRLVRTLTGLVTGAALAAAGLVMQQVSRNPLADPGILGVNAGAALVVVLAVWLIGLRDPLALALAAIMGAALAAAAVFALGRGGQANDSAGILRLTLAGAAVSALCLAFVSTVVLLNQQTRDLYRFWTIGSLATADVARLVWLSPLVLIGLALAAMMARRLDALALGDDSAHSFGVPVAATIGVALTAVALLSGSAVAMAGPIGFVGLVVPHLTRWLTGPAIGRGLLIACPLGGAVVLLCDSLGRIIARPAEVQTGIILALIGGPVFLMLMRRAVR